ncbi:MAG: HAMP domain-containing protein [Caldilineaceae bacterium]
MRRLTDFSPHTIRHKLLLGLLPGFVALLIVLAIGIYAFKILADANTFVVDVVEELAVTRSLRSNVQEVLLLISTNSTGKSYIAVNLRQFIVIADEIDKQLAEATVFYGEVDEQILLARATTNWKYVRLQLTKLLVEPQSSARNLQAQQLLANLETTVNSVGRDLEALHALVISETTTMLATNQSEWHRAMVLLTVTLVLAVTSTGVFLVLFPRSITRPLETLRTGVERIGKGDLTYRLHVDGNDELSILAREFNVMSQRLQDAYAQMEQRNQELATVSRERSRYAAKLRHVLSYNVRVQEAERKRIANGIHDGVSQWLMGALFELQAARVRLPSDLAQSNHHLVEAQRILRFVKEELRRVIYNLHPPVLESSGLVEAIRCYLVEVQQHHALRCAFTVEGAPRRLAQQRELELYRILQEALNNVIKHADAEAVTILLRYDEGTVTLTITDGGKGFEPQHMQQPRRAGLGLVSMRERVIAMGGKWSFDSKPGYGTKVKVVAPIVEVAELLEEGDHSSVDGNGEFILDEVL